MTTENPINTMDILPTPMEVEDKKTINVYWKQIPDPHDFQYFWLHLGIAPYQEEFHRDRPFWVGHSHGSHTDRFPVTYGDIMTNWPSFAVEFDIYRKVTMDNRQWWALEIAMTFSSDDSDDIDRTINITSIKQSSFDGIELSEDYKDEFPNLFLIGGIDEIEMA